MVLCIQSHYPCYRQRRDENARLVRPLSAPFLPFCSPLRALSPSRHRFDVFEFGNINAHEDDAGMLRTVHALNQLITAEVDAGVPAARVVLGGFSQGGAMSLLTGLTAERRLAGLAVLSGWLAAREKAKAVSTTILFGVRKF